MSTPYAILAQFDKPADVMHAAEQVRDAGFRRWDVHTPFAIPAALFLRRQRSASSHPPDSAVRPEETD